MGFGTIDYPISNKDILIIELKNGQTIRLKVGEIYSFAREEKYIALYQYLESKKFLRYGKDGHNYIKVDEIVKITKE